MAQTRASMTASGFGGEDNIRDYIATYSNWGRWGEDDQLGALLESHVRRGVGGRVVRHDDARARERLVQRAEGVRQPVGLVVHAQRHAQVGVRADVVVDGARRALRRQQHVDAERATALRDLTATPSTRC